MLNLYVPEKNGKVVEWENRINDTAVGYKIVVDPSLEEPEIEHCREIYKGEEAISRYLEELARFMESWIRCSCES